MDAEPIIEIQNLSKRFGEVTAIQDLSFTVRRGQVYGLLGPNGAGKTTALRVLTGLERPTSGAVRLFGTPVTPGTATLRRVGCLVEQAAFVPHLSGMRNLRLWWEAGGGRMRDADLDGALAVAGLGDAVEPEGPHLLAGDEAAARVRPRPARPARSCSSSTSRPTASIRARSARSAS